MILLPFLMVYPLSLVTAMYLVKSLKEMPVHFSVGSTPDTYAHITKAAQKGGGESYGESPSKCPPKSRHGPDAETPRPGIVFAPYRTGYWMCLDATCRSFL